MTRLRLEARMPLYGNELADDITPLEAGLGWAVKLDKGDFVGREQIAAREGARASAKNGRIHHWSNVAGRRARTTRCQVDGRDVGS